MHVVEIIGFEIVAFVASIVLTFNSWLAMCQSWRVKKRERTEKAQNWNLRRSLARGGYTGQREYDGHFARLGQPFDSGDGSYILSVSEEELKRDGRKRPARR